MRGRIHGLLAVFLAASVGLVSSAVANIAPPVLVELQGDAVAVAGEPYRGTVFLTAGADITLERLAAGGEGWPTTELSGYAGKLRAGETLEFPLEIVPEETNQPLGIGVTVDGRGFVQAFDLSRAAVDRERNPGALAPTHRRHFANADALRPAAPTKTLVDEYTSQRDAAFLASQAAEPTAGAARVDARTIRVHGQFIYSRDDGQDMPLDGAWVRIMDRDTVGSEELASTLTSSDGSFDISFTWDPCLTCEAQPDIYIQLRLENAQLKVRHNTIVGRVWQWEIGNWENYAGTDIDLATQEPTTGDSRRAMNVFTTATRTWRWLFNRGYNLPGFKIVYPSNVSSNAFYLEPADAVHLPLDRGWDESTQIHEIGHHFESSFATFSFPSYCNGICDEEQWWEIVDVLCGHCMWCEENATDALQEGWPSWLSRQVQTDVAAANGEPLDLDLLSAARESADTCFVDDALDDPLITEGFIASFLWDLTDANADDDPAWPTGDDRLQVEPINILNVIAIADPGTVQEFLTAYLAQNPQYVGDADMWATAANNGYDFDAAPPSPPQNVVCTTHTVGVQSPDATMEFSWDPGSDDWSGIVGYRYRVLPASTISNVVASTVDALEWESPTLIPGSWYFHIQAEDGAGNLSDVVSIGPFLVRTPIPTNLSLTTTGGWSGAVVPHPAPDALEGFTPAPALLPGDLTSTWWNAHIWNGGDDSTGSTHAAWLVLDGLPMIDPFLAGAGFTTAGPTPAMTDEYILNHGPVPVRAGRHSFGVRLDAAGEVAESDEFDNEFAKQWVWEPNTVLANTDYERQAPPRRNAGWEWSGGDPLFFNSDGMRFMSTGRWNAFYASPQGTGDDYDVALHVASTGATNGFDVPVTLSARGPGCLDAVLVNRGRSAPPAAWDVGITRITENSYQPYDARHVEGGSMGFDVPTQFTMPYDQFLQIWELTIFPGSEGPITVDLDLIQAAPERGPLHVGWFDDTTITGSLLDALAIATTDANQSARLELNAPLDGTYALVVWRDRKDDWLELDYRLHVHPTRPDFAPWELAAWPTPVMPRPDAVFGEGDDPTPAMLHGDLASTWIGSAVANLTPVPSSNEVHHWVQVDGATVYDKNYGFGIAGYEEDLFVTPTALSIPGGRHTVSYRLEGPDAYLENDESNNKAGAQWIFDPASVPAGVVVQRSAPPDRRGGWDTIPYGETFHYNVDGFRTPVFDTTPPQPQFAQDGWWGAVSVVPYAGNDFDMALYELATGPQAGFEESLASSAWGASQTDFVLINFNADPLGFRAFDVGVTHSTGTDPYQLRVDSSLFLGYYPNLSAGPYSMLGGTGDNAQMMNLHEVWLDPGVYLVGLANLLGTVNWGMSAYDSSEGMFFGKSDHIEGAISWYAEDAEPESFQFTANSAGPYMIAVWKAYSDDLPKEGSYQLSFQQVTSAPELPQVTRSALREIRPNPFNPRTSIHFDLVQSGQVKIAVYNLRGELVHVLLESRNHAAGSHQVVWDGKDQLGQSVASGTYIVRFEGDGISESRKVTMLK